MPDASSVDKSINDPTAATTREAILLLGPTGSGKTPLGQSLQERGLWGHACRHFDFGANLREIVARNQPDESISAEDIAILDRVVREGLLLEGEHFPLAARIVRRFMARRAPDPATWIVLNGLPRHLGQAQAMEDLVAVRAVVHLACTDEVVAQRIETNAGGDRARREDDAPEAIRRKLSIFNERTAPLLEHYRDRHVRVLTLDVGPQTPAEEMWRALESNGPLD
ncbi:MAG: adenylate kinase family protein [Pirellulales bacterium]